MNANKHILLIKEAVREFFADNCPLLAASIAFYLLFALFPLALVAISVTGFVLKSTAAQAAVIAGIGNLLPVSGDLIAGTIKGVVNNRGVIGIVAVIVFILGGMSLFYAVSKALNAAWSIRQPRVFLRERLLNFCMMVGAGLLLLITMLLSAGFRAFYQLDIPVWGLLISDNLLLWHLILFLINTIITFLVFLFLYKFVPNIRIRWRDIWIGALVAAICFEIAKFFFVWLVGNSGYYNLVYGPIGALIALLVWAYVSAVIFLFCAKLTSAYAGQR
ncbi:YihY/virulence factor BrkB family protein [Chloroflexota bacterium]